jgi:hypothetical protein
VESGLNYGYETMRGTQEVGRGVFMWWQKNARYIGAKRNRSRGNSSNNSK